MNENVVESIYNKMVESITNGQWAAGSKIPTENELAKTYQVSRSSVRQAISRLKALGLLESRQGSGTVIKKSGISATLSDIIPTIMFEIEDNLQIFEFHKGIQIECAKLACLRYTDEQMEQLMFHSRKMNEYYSDDNRNRAIFHDLECHKTICEMSGNLMFVRATEIIYQRLEQCFFQICATFDYKESIVFHERLIAALKDRNPIFSSSVMEAALRVYNGKPIVNSVNGEEASLQNILPLVKKYGAAVVGLTLDENGIPKKAADRFAIAKRILDRATALGIPKRDVYIDCLTLTASAEQDGAKETLEALHRVKTELKSEAKRS